MMIYSENSRVSVKHVHIILNNPFLVYTTKFEIENVCFTMFAKINVFCSWEENSLEDLQRLLMDMVIGGWH